MAWSPFFSPSPRPALPDVRPVALKAGLRGGKTALMWHRLRQESAAAGRPITCVTCARPHAVAPPLGRCVCGGCLFGVYSADVRQPSLPLLGVDHG